MMLRLNNSNTLRRIDSIDSTTQKHNELNKPNKLNKRSQQPRRLKSIRKSDPLGSRFREIPAIPREIYRRRDWIIN